MLIMLTFCDKMLCITCNKNDVLTLIYSYKTKNTTLFYALGETY